MVDLFNTVANADGVTKNPDILEGNTVRSFLDKSKGWGVPEVLVGLCFVSAPQPCLSSSPERGDAVPLRPLQRGQEREGPGGRAAPLPPLAQGHRWAQKAPLVPGEGGWDGDRMGTRLRTGMEAGMCPCLHVGLPLARCSHSPAVGARRCSGNSCDQGPSHCPRWLLTIIPAPACSNQGTRRFGHTQAASSPPPVSPQFLCLGSLPWAVYNPLCYLPRSASTKCWRGARRPRRGAGSCWRPGWSRCRTRAGRSSPSPRL